MKIKTMVGLSLLLCANCVFAQNKEFNISGKVLDSNTQEPLMGVYMTTGKKGAQTDHKGHFIIKDVPEGAVKLSTMYYSS